MGLDVYVGGVFDYFEDLFVYVEDGVVVGL